MTIEKKRTSKDKNSRWETIHTLIKEKRNFSYDPTNDIYEIIIKEVELIERKSDKIIKLILREDQISKNIKIIIFFYKHMK